jgi:hypothetical protein
VDGGNNSPMTAGEETKEAKAVLNMATKVLWYSTQTRRSTVIILTESLG